MASQGETKHTPFKIQLRKVSWLHLENTHQNVFTKLVYIFFIK